MTGTLGLFSLLDLIQLLSSSSRTGCLNVKHPTNEVEFYFQNGKLVHAIFGNLRGEEAVIALFKDEQGAFEFLVGVKTPETSITKSTENLLLIAIRAADDNNKSTKTTQISETAVPVFAKDAPDVGNLTLYAQEVSILRLIDSKTSVSNIAQVAGLSIDEVQKIIARLMRIGALSLRNKKPRVARLVTQLSKIILPTNSVGIDKNIMYRWQKVLNYLPIQVACKQATGNVMVFQAEVVGDIGPYIWMSQDTFFKNSLSANMTLLVRPVIDE